MSGSVALVTGGARGIGLGIALGLAGAGHRVAIVDKDEAALAAAVASEAAGGALFPFVGDISDIETLPALVDAIAARLGSPLVLVNNAAKGGGGKLVDVSAEAYDSVFEVSVRGAFFLAKAIVPGMQAARFGRIINVSSLIAAKGDQANSHYAAAKAAMIGFTRSWALELAPFGITSNAILPALTDTDMTRSAFGEEMLRTRIAAIPMRRLATPEDCAAIAVFLASRDAAFVTGQVLSANGGEFVGSL